jgi:hypothetical protein
MKFISGEAQFDSSWISTEANGGFWQHICNGDLWDSGLTVPVTEQPYDKTVPIHPMVPFGSNPLQMHIFETHVGDPENIHFCQE